MDRRFRGEFGPARAPFVYIEGVLAKLRKRIDRERMFASEGAIGVGLSGGADSVALLHALREIYPDRPIAAAHLNHCLRGADSDADEAFVRQLADELDCQCFVRREDVAVAAASDGNLEQAGRQARYRFFDELVAAGSCAEIATAHTLSDQAETVLFRLLRGACGDGLSGVWPVVQGRIVRPMLDVSRSDVMAYLKDRGVAWREDASNSDPAFARNRLRHHLLPQLRQQWNPNIDAALARTADWSVEEERFWNDRTAELLAACVERDGACICLDAQVLQAMSVAEQRRVLLAACNQADLAGRQLGFEHVEALRELVLSDTGGGVAELPGIRAERSFSRVRLCSPDTATCEPYDLPLPVPGRVPLPGGAGSVISTRVLDSVSPSMLYDEGVIGLLDWDCIPRSLRLRSWREGDRYMPAGLSAPHKIKELFQRRRVSAWERAGWPVVEAGEGVERRILWARAFGPAGEFAVRANSKRALVVEEIGAKRGGSVANRTVSCV